MKSDIRLDYLKMKNFMCFKSKTIDFADKSIIGIVGRNRHGKTTINSAIRFALSGNHKLDSVQDLVSHGEKEMNIELGLKDLVSKKKYTIYRGVKGKAGYINYEGIDKIGPAQEAISELTGYTPDELDFTAICNQFEVTQFFKLGATDQQKYFLKWFNNSHWISLYEKVNADIKKFNEKVIELRASISTLEEECYDEEDLRDRIKSTKSKIEKCEKSIKKAEGKHEDFVRTKERIKSLKRDLDDLGDVDKVKAKDMSSFDIKEERKKLSALQLKRTKNTQKKKDLKKKLEGITNSCGTCPILKEQCDRVSPDEADTVKPELKSTVSMLESLEKQIDNIESSIEKYDEYLESKKSSDAYKKLKDIKKKLKAEKNKLEGFDSEILESKNDELELLIEKLGKLKSRLSKNKKIREKIEKKSEDLNKKQKKLSVMKYTAMMFGPQGIRSQEIENSFDEIQDEVNEILLRTNLPMSLHFDPERVLNTLEDVCRGCGSDFPKSQKVKSCENCGKVRGKKTKDEFKLWVEEEGNRQGFKNDSGGGQTLIALAMRLTIFKMKCEKNNAGLNFIMLDEPDQALDKTNIKNFVKLLTQFVCKDLGIGQVIWISHDPDIKELIPDVLKVKKKGSYSKAKWL